MSLTLVVQYTKTSKTQINITCSWTLHHVYYVKSMHAWAKSQKKAPTPPTLSSVIMSHLMKLCDEKRRISAVSVFYVISHAATHDKWTHSCSPIGCEQRHHAPPVINSSRLLAPLVFVSLPSNFPAVYWVSAERNCNIEIKILWKLTTRVLQRVKGLLKGGSDPLLRASK